MINLAVLSILATIKFWSLLLVGLMDRRPRCITCRKRYAADNGMFGECAECVFGSPFQSTYTTEEIERNHRLSVAIFNAINDDEQSEELLEVPIFDNTGMKPFIFGVDAYGNMVVRQIHEDGSETWQYIGTDD